MNLWAKRSTFGRKKVINLRKKSSFYKEKCRILWEKVYWKKWKLMRNNLYIYKIKLLILWEKVRNLQKKDVHLWETSNKFITKSKKKNSKK